MDIWVEDEKGVEESKGAGGGQGSPPLACPSRYSVGDVAGLDATFVIATTADLTRNESLSCS